MVTYICGNIPTECIGIEVKGISATIFTKFTIKDPIFASCGGSRDLNIIHKFWLITRKRHTLKCEHPANPTRNLVLITDGAATFGTVPVTPNWYPCLAKARPKSTGLRETPFMAVVMSNTVAIPATSLIINDESLFMSHEILLWCFDSFFDGVWVQVHALSQVCVEFDGNISIGSFELSLWFIIHAGCQFVADWGQWTTKAALKQILSRTVWVSDRESLSIGVRWTENVPCSSQFCDLLWLNLRFWKWLYSFRIHLGWPWLRCQRKSPCWQSHVILYRYLLL